MTLTDTEESIPFYTSNQDMSGMTRAQLDAAMNVASTVVAVGNDNPMFTIASPVSVSGLGLVTGSNTITASETVSGLSSSATQSFVSTSTWTWAHSFDGTDPMGGATLTSGTLGANVYNVNTADSDGEFAFIKGAGTNTKFVYNEQALGANQRITSFKAEHDFDITGTGEVFNFRLRNDATAKGLVKQFNAPSTAASNTIVVSWNGATL